MRAAVIGPESLGLDAADPTTTYLSDMQSGLRRAWIGTKWDVAETQQGRFTVYRKGNYVLTVGTLDLALAIVADNEGFPNG